VNTFLNLEENKFNADYFLDIITPDIKNNKIFYTDSNGLYMMKREIDKREDYPPFNSKEQNTE
jgi:hypothetical protein